MYGRAMMSWTDQNGMIKVSVKVKISGAFVAIHIEFLSVIENIV